MGVLPYNITIQAYVAKELEMRENGKAITQKADARIWRKRCYFK